MPSATTASSYLNTLCLDIPSRRTGSPGNRAATSFFANTVATFGFTVETPEFECIDWVEHGAELTVDGIPFAVSVSPYSLGGQASGPLVAISTVQELEMAQLSGQVLLLHGDIAKAQLMPKNFPFYNPQEHQHIIALLERKQPLAIIAATGRDPEMAGAVYPFPLFEDGDFDIPSVYLPEEAGSQLAALAGRTATIHIRAHRSPATGCNVVARKGDPQRRIVLFAHIDAKDGTLGAIDNATGVVVLLLLGELLADYAGGLGVEIVAMNGEDYYSGPGEQLYLALNTGRMAEIVLGINLDGAGYHQGHTAYSLYGCPADLASTIHDVFATHAELREGEPWYQSDHGLFLMHQVPALAITSERFVELWTEIAHTSRDRPEIVDPNKLVAAAGALRNLVLRLDRTTG
jgi:aminopeptidase YwaD